MQETALREVRSVGLDPKGFDVQSFEMPAQVMAYSLAVYAIMSMALGIAYMRHFRSGSSAKVFLNYRRSDSEPITARVFDRLVDRNGVRVRNDPDFESDVERLVEAIEESVVL